jgi:hypothetical protein
LHYALFFTPPCHAITIIIFAAGGYAHTSLLPPTHLAAAKLENFQSNAYWFSRSPSLLLWAIFLANWKVAHTRCAKYNANVSSPFFAAAAGRFA